MPLEIHSKTVPAPYKSDPRIERDSNGTWHVRGYAEARDLLKEEMIQEGFNAADLRKAGFEAVLYQHGEPHRQSRAAIARFFSPTTVQQSHIPLIESTADEIMADLKSKKRANLRELSRQMATVVASAVIGLTPTKAMIRRLDIMLHSPAYSGNPIVQWLQSLRGNYLRFAFFFGDVMPAISRRRKSPQNDVVSHMLSKGKRPLDIWLECVVYAAAGMATTQEFICIVLLHCLRDEKFRNIMTSDNTSARYEALNEILRLEPVIGKLYRRTHEPVTVTSEGKEVTIPEGEKITFHVYDVNVDSKAVREAPTELNTQRKMEKGVYRSMIGFGSGPHRCAGEHLALAETDIFIHKILQIPGLRIESGPNIMRNDTVEGYEVNDLILVVD
ncbi:MAG TPA: cytochrome P450 [Anaerolineales bacterium]|nr:cytochrome P450 [Anaerolineales bacterium]